MAETTALAAALGAAPFPIVMVAELSTTEPSITLAEPARLGLMTLIGTALSVLPPPKLINAVGRVAGTAATADTTGCEVPAPTMIDLPLNSDPCGAVIVMVWPVTVAVNPFVTLFLMSMALMELAMPSGRSTTVIAGTIVMPLTLMAPSVAGTLLDWPVAGLPLILMLATADAPAVGRP